MNQIERGDHLIARTAAAPLAKVLDLSLGVVRCAHGAGISLNEARAFIALLVALPGEHAELVIAEARRELVRKANREVRREDDRRTR